MQEHSSGNATYSINNEMMQAITWKRNLEYFDAVPKQKDLIFSTISFLNH